MYSARRTLTIAFSTVAALATLLSSFWLVPAAAADSGSGYNGHQIKVTPLVQETKLTSAAHFSCQDRPLDSGAPRCYQPAQIQAAYNFTPLLNHGLNGHGETIAIVDAYSSPYVAQDLHIFDQTFGLPDPTLQIIAPNGQTPFDITDPNQVGWAEEITLDVLWAHAVAPGAKIVLALAKTNDDRDIFNATQYVVTHNLGDVISQSFGEGEACMDPRLLLAQHLLFLGATLRHISLIASAGDNGAGQPACDGSNSLFLSASTPASDPFVLGVGGTNLNADANTGAYIGERAWADAFSGCFPTSQFGCSGGGFSSIYHRPFFQLGVAHVQDNHRGVPDVAYNAGVDGGVLTHCGVCNAVFGLDPADPTIFFIFGGTSAGSPQWAGLTAIADQAAGHRLGWLDPAIYRIGQSPAKYAAAFHDITTGNNNLDDVTGYQAQSHWDAVTGWGTPNAAGLVPLLKSNHDDRDDTRGDN